MKPLSTVVCRLAVDWAPVKDQMHPPECQNWCSAHLDEWEWQLTQWVAGEQTDLVVTIDSDDPFDVNHQSDSTSGLAKMWVHSGAGTIIGANTGVSSIGVAVSIRSVLRNSTKGTSSRGFAGFKRV